MRLVLRRLSTSVSVPLWVECRSSRGLTELRRPEPLDPQRHDRSAFESGSPDLDEWLRRYSGQNRRRNTAATWVITTADMAVVAYVSLAMTGIDRSAAPSLVAKGAPDPVPALLIGRLAVDRNQSGLGIGSALVAHVLATAVSLNATVACRAVVVRRDRRHRPVVVGEVRFPPV
ncbi:MAG: GNAT family N-acetyltransferase [Microthrixaceae bacterium]